MNCDLCGGEEKLYRTLVEGTELSVCSKCSSFGKVLREIKQEEAKPQKKEKEVKILQKKKEKILLIVPDYAKRVRKAREKLGLKQKDFAKKISEKESVVHKLEIGQFEPSIRLARKLERLLKIKLVEQHEEEPVSLEKMDNEALTVGDLIKIKRSSQ